MAVTAVKSDGWAIEHTNLGTIRLTDAGPDRTDVAIAAEPPNHPEPQQLAAVFDRFVRQIQSRFHVESQSHDHPSGDHRGSAPRPRRLPP